MGRVAAFPTESAPGSTARWGLLNGSKLKHGGIGIPVTKGLHFYATNQILNCFWAV